MDSPATLLWRFVSRGNHPVLPAEERLKQSILTLIALFIAVLAVGWGTLYLLAGYPVSGAIPLSYALISFLSMGDYFVRKHFAFFRDSQLLLIFLLPFLLMWSLGGFANGSAVMIWALFTPLAAVFFADMRRAIGWLIAFVLFTVLSGILDPVLRLRVPPMPADVNVAFFVMNLAASGIGVFLVMYYFRRESLDAQQRMAHANRELASAYRLLKENEAKIHELMLTDPLTGVANRRALNERLQAELQRCHRYGRALGCILLDVDHFKTINDRHGHLIGDRVLQALARLLRSAVRELDFVARYGGEEFVILLPETDLAGATRFAERLRREIAGLRVPQGPAMITASFGVTACNPGDSPDDLLRRADEALYAAKHDGRDRVVGQA